MNLYEVVANISEDIKATGVKPHNKKELKDTAIFSIGMDENEKKISVAVAADNEQLRYMFLGMLKNNPSLYDTLDEILLEAEEMGFVKPDTDYLHGECGECEDCRRRAKLKETTDLDCYGDQRRVILLAKRLTQITKRDESSRACLVIYYDNLIRDSVGLIGGNGNYIVMSLLGMCVKIQGFAMMLMGAIRKYMEYGDKLEEVANKFHSMTGQMFGDILKKKNPEDIN